MLFGLSSRHIFCRKNCLRIAFLSVFLCCIQSAQLFADEISDTLAKTDITEVGMNMFSTAYQWESKAKDGFTKQALEGFTAKLNAELLKKRKENNDIGQLFTLCECDQIFDEAFDEYLLAQPAPEKLTGEIIYTISIWSYSNPGFEGKPIPNGSQVEVKKIIDAMLLSITTQTKEQMSAFQSISGVGLYMDGDVENSPYDLLDDIRRIDEIFFREAPEYGDYKNTNKDDVGALITGRVMQGSWAGGETYTIDLASDIENALGGGDEGQSGGAAGGNTLAGDCSSGYCITIDFVKNTSYFLGTGGIGRESFQGIYEEALSWLAQKGDKINLGCKSPPTMNVWELNTDFNFNFKDLFSGVSVSVDTKTPPFLDGYYKKTDSAEADKKEKKEKAAVIDALKRQSNSYGIDFDKSSDLKTNLKESFENVGIRSSMQDSEQAYSAVLGLKEGREQFESMKIANGLLDNNKTNIKEKTVQSTKHLEKTFDEMAARVRFLVQHIQSMEQILTYLDKKGYCQN